MSWLSDDEIAAVVRETTDVLEGIGMRMSGSRALEALAAAGARVEGDVVHFPAKLLLEAVAQCPRVVTMAGETSDVVLDGGRSYFCVSGCGAKTLDFRSGKLRPSTLADLRERIVVLDATPELDVDVDLPHGERHRA